jgi:alkylhydroperoxidase family enzyme
MPYIPLVEEPRGLIGRMAFRWGRRKFGTTVQPLQAAAHHTGVLLAAGATETAAEKGWKTLDPELRWLAIQRVSSSIGCSWCIDYGWYLGHQERIDPAKVTEVSRWRESAVYDETERLVLEYAETASATPAVVDPQVVVQLTERLGEKAVVELAAWVALEHYRSRFNAGLGLRSQGFAESCAVPGDVPASLKVAG